MKQKTFKRASLCSLCWDYAFLTFASVATFPISKPLKARGSKDEPLQHISSCSRKQVLEKSQPTDLLTGILPMVRTGSLRNLHAELLPLIEARDLKQKSAPS